MTLDDVATRTTTPSGAARLATWATEASSGVPVAFLHAGVADSRMWRSEFDALSPSHRCIAFDRRGFGATLPASERFDDVVDTLAVLDATGTGRAVLVGCSNGGRIAIDVALASPDRVAGLVLVCAGIGGAPESDAWVSDPTMAAHFARWQAAESAHDHATLLAVARRVWLDGPLEDAGRVGEPVRSLFDDMAGIALATGEDDALGDFPDTAYARLATIDVPTLVVSGPLEVRDVTTTMRHAAATIARAEAFEVPGTAHLPNLERPDLFVPRVARFVATIG